VLWYVLRFADYILTQLFPWVGIVFIAFINLYQLVGITHKNNG